PTSVPPTVAPPTATPVPPTPTTPPTTNTPVSGTLSPVQSASHFTDYAGVRKSYATFPQPVSMGHLLVAVISVAGGNPYIVDHVADNLGNSWKKAVAGVNGDNTDVEIWFTNSASSGTDEVHAYI